MQQPTTDLVLHLPSSSQEEEEADQLASPENPDMQLPIQSFKQIEIEVPIQIIKKYEPINVLHQTQKSIVVRCYKKRVQEQDEPGELEKVIIKFSNEAVREGKILQEIQQHSEGKHIVKCLEIYEKAIVLESCQESLSYIIYSNKHLGNLFCLKLFTDFVDILQNLHKANIVHYDIKPSNILYRSKNGYITDFVLADFGNSIRLGAEAQQEQNKPLNQNIQCFQQSFQYYAPQSLTSENRRITQKSDIWGLGCILFECITGQTLLPTEADTPRSYWKLLSQIATENMIKVRLERFSFPSQYKLFGQLVYSLLKQNPEQRPSIQELKEKIEYLKARIS